MLKRFNTSVVVACAGLILGVGAATFAADATSEPQFQASSGEKPETIAREKAIPITAYEDDAKVGGGGAPQKVIVDNEFMRVNLVSFKKGFIRPGSVRRKNEQLLVYVDEGAYTTMKSADGTPAAKQTPRRLQRGSSVFHYRDTMVTENRIDDDYRVLFIELKKR